MRQSLSEENLLSQEKGKLLLASCCMEYYKLMKNNISKSLFGMKKLGRT